MQQPGKPIKAQGSSVFLCKIVFFDCERCHATRSKTARAFCGAEDIEQLPFTVVGTARWLSKSCTNTNKYKYKDRDSDANYKYTDALTNANIEQLPFTDVVTEVV